MTLVRETEHVSRGLSNLLEQYKGRPRMEAWIASFLEEVQELSDAAWSVLVSRAVTDATSAQLTTLGKLVGQERTDEDDDRYRVLVVARIRINRSNGHWRDVLAVYNLISAVRKRFFRVGNANLFFEMLDEPDIDPVLLVRMLRQAKAAGVGLALVAPAYEMDHALLFISVGDESEASHAFTDTSSSFEAGEFADAVTIR